MKPCYLVIRWAIMIGFFCTCLWSCKPQEHRQDQPAVTSSEQSQPANTQPNSATEGLIVAMGDSLTAGFGIPEDQAYPALLERKLRADGYAYQVINAGVSGETSSGALTRTEWMLTLEPDIVILETGANDGFRGIDPSVIQHNIESIVKTLQAKNVVVVLAGMEMVRNLGESYIRAFAQVYDRIAEQYNLIFMPFFLQGVGGEPSLNQSDGIHPTAAGYERIVKNLYPYVIQAIQKRQRQP